MRTHCRKCHFQKFRATSSLVMLRKKWTPVPARATLRDVRLFVWAAASTGMCITLPCQTKKWPDRRSNSQPQDYEVSTEPFACISFRKRRKINKPPKVQSKNIFWFDLFDVKVASPKVWWTVEGVVRWHSPSFILVVSFIQFDTQHVLRSICANLTQSTRQIYCIILGMSKCS